MNKQDDVKILSDALGAGPTPGPWRFLLDPDFIALYGSVSEAGQRDLHGGLTCRECGHDPDECGSYVLSVELLSQHTGESIAPSREDMAYIEAASPDRISRLLDQLGSYRLKATQLDKLLPAPQEIKSNTEVCALYTQSQPDEWPKLDKPARVGGGTFGVGVSARLVVMAAQRAHEGHAKDAAMTWEERVDDERNRRALWDMVHGPIDAKQQQHQAEQAYDRHD